MHLEASGIGSGIAGESLHAPAARQDDAIGESLDAQSMAIALAPAEEQVDWTIEQRGHQIGPLGELGFVAEKRRRTGPPAATDGRAIAGNEQPVAVFDPLLQ